MKQLSQAVPLQLIKWNGGLGDGGGREAEGLEPVCQLCKVAVRKLNKDPIPRLKGAETLEAKQNSPPSNYLRREGWGRNVDSEDLGRTGAIMPFTLAWHFF